MRFTSDCSSEPVRGRVLCGRVFLSASPAPALQQATLNAYFSPAAAGAHRATRMMMAAEAAQEAATARQASVSPPQTQPDNDIVLSMEF